MQDANGNPVEMVWSPSGSNLKHVADALDNHTSLAYDGYNNLTQVVNAREMTTTYRYDHEDFPTFLTSMTDGLGKTTYYTPTTTADGVPGLLKQEEDANGRLTTYTYNDFGQVTQVVQAVGTGAALTTTYGYDGVGRQITTTQESATESHTSLNVYDDGDRLTAIIGNWTGSNPANWETDCDTSTGARDTDICYDNVGRLITTTLPNNVQTVNVYDDANRLIQLTHTDTTSDTLLADYTYQLDKLGNRTVATETVRLPGTVIGTGTISLSIGSHVTVTTAAGNQTAVAIAHNPNADDYLAVWQDNFNDTGDLYAQRLDSNGGAVLSPTLVHSPTTNTQQATAVSFSDADDNYLVVWEDGRTYSSRPDIYGRIFTNTGQPITTEFTIEAARRSYETPDVVFDPHSGDFVVIWTRETGTATQRDIRAQFVTVTGTLGTSIDVATTNANEYVPALATDGSGNFLAVWRDNIGTSADLYAQRFDANGLVGSVMTITTATNRQDVPDVAYESTSDQYLIVWEDDRSGTTQMYGQRVNGNGTLAGSNMRLDNGSSAVSYPAVAETSGVFVVGWGDGDLYLRTVDTDGNLGSVETLSNKSNTQQDLALTSAGSGNILAAWESNEDGNDHEIVTSLLTVTTGSGGGLQTTTIAYDYDPLYRLTGATYSGGHAATYAYVYDAVGNMTSYTETVSSETTLVNRTFDDANQLETANDTETGTTSFYYDGNGNLVEMMPPGASGQDPAGTIQYGFDQRNLLITNTTYISGTGWMLLAEFRYDGDGNRVQQINYGQSQPVTTTYTNDNMGLSQVLVADDGTTQTTNLFGLDLIQQDNGTEIRVLLGDGLGSVRQELVGTTIERVTTYDPYGSLLSSQGESGTTYGFTGEQKDSITGLVYLRVRYYNPYLKLFLSRDPFPGYMRRPSTQHSYLYVSNNPVNEVDPSGLCGEVGDESCWAIYERIIRKYPELANIPVVALMSETQLYQLEQTYETFPTAGYIHTQNYGTFDLKHVRVEKSHRLIQDVKSAIGLPAGHMFPIPVQTLIPNKIPGINTKSWAGYEAWYWVSGDIIPEQVNGVALGILMDFEMRWETWQRMSGIGIPSSYATEDLQSDYLGHFLASQGFRKNDAHSLAVAFALLGCYEHDSKSTTVTF